MMILTALLGIKELVLFIIGACIFSFLVVTAIDSAYNKERKKAMAAPTEVAKEMGLTLFHRKGKDDEISAVGKNYAFVMQYSSAKGQYHAFIYDRESGKYKMSIVSDDYNAVLKSAKELVENLEKI